MRLIIGSLILLVTAGPGRALAALPVELAAKYNLVTAAPPSPLSLRQGDRLAICGDSITEQKMYSRIIEDYLTMCAPQLEVSVRQYGWGGERAPGFLGRMTNDCLRFNPTVATTCYGMNDHEYRQYEPRIGMTYRSNSLAILEAFRARGVRVVQGSPGCVGKVPGWTKRTNDTVDELNWNLAQLRNFGLQLARTEGAGFADIFPLMIEAGATAKSQYGPDYAIAGKDGVHPGWAGHTIMAYAFLKALGLGETLATFEVDLSANSASASPGHQVVRVKPGEFEIRSSRYPFCVCAPAGDSSAYPVCGQDGPHSDNSIRSGLTLAPFNQSLNRFMLIVRNPQARAYRVAWGNTSRRFDSEQLALGLNLAAEFPENPFSPYFAKVDAAVLAKQTFETRQIKQEFRAPEAIHNLAAVVARTEREREALVRAVQAAFVPVTHTLRITPE